MFKKLKLRRKNIFRCAVKFKSRLQRFVSDVRTVPYTGKLRILIKSISVLYEKYFVSTEHSTTLGNNIFVYADYEKDTIWKSNMTHKTLDMDILLFSKFYVCRFGHPFMISRYTRWRMSFEVLNICNCKSLNLIIYLTVNCQLKLYFVQLCVRVVELRHRFIDMYRDRV